MALMEDQPFSQAFRRRQPAFNGLIWAYHWLQVGLYEPLIVAAHAGRAPRPASTATVARFWAHAGVRRAVSPRDADDGGRRARVFRGGIRARPRIFDNLHMMHDIISDVLAAPDIPRERKREVIAAQLAEFRSAGRNVLTTDEWRAMSGQMGGVDAMGGAVPGPAAADSAAPAPPAMEHHHH